MATTKRSTKQTSQKSAGSNATGGGRASAKTARGRGSAKATSGGAGRGSRTAGATATKPTRSKRSSASTRASGSSPRRRAASRRTAGKTATSSNGSSSNDSLRTNVVRGAVGAVVGGAAFAVAKLANRRSRPRLLGLRVPDELNPQRMDAGKLAAQGKDLVRHIGDFAEQVEARSEDVRSLSGQAKRLSRRIS